MQYGLVGTSDRPDYCKHEGVQLQWLDLTDKRQERAILLDRLVTERIVILDGPMGTMIQGYGIDEAGFRGDRFADHPCNLQGNNDLLSLTRPDVIRAILLYYLTPIWSALLARAWLKEPITRDRVVAIVLGSLGLLAILKADQGLPIPRNSGDWMAFISGLFWALTANIMRHESRQYTVDVLIAWFFWASVFGLVLGILPILDRPPIPELRQILGVLPWFIPVVLFMIIPGFYAISWGVPLLNPGTVGVLFMTEISVGAISAALLTDELFGTREILGVVLITAAGLTEAVVPILSSFFHVHRNKRG